MTLPKLLVDGALIDGEAITVYRDAACSKPYSFQSESSFPKHLDVGYTLRGPVYVYDLEYNVWRQENDNPRKYPYLFPTSDPNDMETSADSIER